MSDVTSQQSPTMRPAYTKTPLYRGIRILAGRRAKARHDIGLTVSPVISVGPYVVARRMHVSNHS